MTRGVTILLLEDSPLDAELIRAQVEKVDRGAKIYRVVARQEFEEAIQSFRPDLILSDYSLPDFDGMSALAFARDHLPETPFIFVSGTLGEDIAIEALHNGATDYVLKQRLHRLAPSVVRVLHENELKRKQRQSDDALQASQLRFRELADAIPQLVWATDSAGNVIYTNRWARHYGAPLVPTDVPGLSFCHPDDQPRLRRVWSQCLHTHAANGLEYRLRRAEDNTYRWHLCRFVPMHDRENRIESWVVAAMEVEEQKRREQSLEASERALREAKETLEVQVQERTRAYATLNARLLTIQDDERRRIARDLHDGFGQTMVALKMNLDMLSVSQAVRGQRGMDLLQQSCELLQNCLSEVRTMSYLLHPPLLDEAGFTTAAAWYVKGFTERSGIEADLQTPPHLGRLPSEIEVVLFRVLQAGLSNVHRHASAQRVEVVVSLDSRTVEMSIRDYGIGISEEKIQAFRNGGLAVGVGLAGMRERVRDLKGTLELFGENGTTVRVRLPLDTTQAESLSLSGSIRMGSQISAPPSRKSDEFLV